MIVYFVRRFSDSAIKIGCCSTSRFAERESRLRRYIRSRAVGGGVELARTPGYLFVERWFHARHREAALGREWFKSSHQLRSDIDAINCIGRCSDEQPEEPLTIYGGNTAPPDFWRALREDVFGLNQIEMAELFGWSLQSLCACETTGTSLTRCAEIDVAARKVGIDFRWNTHIYVEDAIPVIRRHPSRMLFDLRHHRYRAHAVRSIGEVRL